MGGTVRQIFAEQLRRLKQQDRRVMQRALLKYHNAGSRLTKER